MENISGAGLIFAYIISILGFIVGTVMFCYSSDYYSAQSLDECEDDMGNVGIPRTTLLSAVSGMAGLTGMVAPNAYQECSYKPTTVLMP